MHESLYWTGAFTSQFQQLIFVQTTLELCGSDICHQPIRFFIDFHQAPNVLKQAGPYIHGCTTSDRGSCYGIWSLEASPVNGPTWTGLVETSTPWTVKIFKWFLKNMLQKRAAKNAFFNIPKTAPFPVHHFTRHLSLSPKTQEACTRKGVASWWCWVPVPTWSRLTLHPRSASLKAWGWVWGPPTPSNGKHRCWHVWKKQVLVQDELTKPPLYK